MAHRFTLVLTLFFLAILALLYWGSSLQIVIFQDRENIGHAPSQQSQQSPSTLLHLRYFKTDSQGHPWLRLHSESMATDGNGEGLVFQRPQGALLRPGVGGTLRFRAQSAHYQPAQQKLAMEGAAQITAPRSQLSAEHISYHGQFYARGQVRGSSWDPASGDRIELRAQYAQAWPLSGRLRCWGAVEGQVLRQRSFEQGLDFSSNEINLDRGQQRLQLQGGVRLKRRNFVARARRGEVYLGNYNKKLKYYLLSDDVRLMEFSAEGGAIRKGHGEKLEGYVQERKVVLSGGPRVIQGKNVVRGNLITLFEDTRVVKVDDSATTLFLEKPRSEGPSQ